MADTPGPNPGAPNPGVEVQVLPSAPASSFDMYVRCSLAQWRGYGPAMRAAITMAWEKGHVPPAASVGGHYQTTIWKVEHLDAHGNLRPSRTSDVLICVKDDYAPEEATLKFLDAAMEDAP